MKIKSKRHPDRKIREIQHVVLPVIPKSIWDIQPIDPAIFKYQDDISFFVNVYPVTENDFLPTPPPISAVDFKETVDLVQRGIIDRKQFFNDLMMCMHNDEGEWIHEPVTSSTKFHTRYNT